VGLLVSGGLGKRIFESPMIGMKPSRCIENLSNTAKGNDPFYYIIDKSLYTDTDTLKRHFVHKITHWNVYKFYTPNISITNNPEIEAYYEAIAFMAERDICELKSLCFDNNKLTATHKKALDIIKHKKKDEIISIIKSYGNNKNR
jgi:hypothetical protein